ncbi:GINS complex subunit Psf3, partial [Ramicandelaber brevisporus]
EDYYDIDDILAEQMPIPCTFNFSVSGLASLQPDENVLPKGTKVELPFWLASNLAFPEYVSVDLPSTYSKKTRNKLNASFISVNFHSLCPYYYRLGVKLADMIDDDDLPNTLTEVFRERAQAVLAKTHTVLEGVANDSAYFVAKLDETEKELFALGVDS